MKTTTTTWFDSVTTYGEELGAGWYWTMEGIGWVGPFETQDEAAEDAKGDW